MSFEYAYLELVTPPYLGSYNLQNRRIPLRMDGDAADLYRRITGKKHPTLKGEMSAEYKAFLKGKR